MRSRDYWEGRFLALEQRQHSEAEALNAEMAKIFAREYASLQGEIDAWYGRYANGIGMAEAKKQLTAGELAEFKWTVEDFIKHAKGNQSGEFTQQMDRVHERVHISRLEALQWQVKSHADRLGVAQEAGLAGALKGAIADQYHRTAYEVQKGVGVGASFAQYDEKVLERAMLRPWAADGSNFSERIWKNRDVLSARLQQEVERAMISGENPRELARRLQKEFGVAKHQAERLARTELAHASEMAKLESFKELGLEHVEISAALDSRTCPVCGELDSKLIRLTDATPGVTTPPFHANCRCCMLPHDEDFDELFPDAERIARDEDGETFKVPASMTYGEWAEAQAEIALKRQFDTLASALGRDAPSTFSVFQALSSAVRKKMQIDADRRKALTAKPKLALPNVEDAYIEDTKFIGYFFKEGSKGWSKGVAFSSHLGYNSSNWEEMRDEILEKVAKNPVDIRESGEHGKKYEIPMMLYGKTGNPMDVRTVWIIETGGKPRLVTATMNTKGGRLR